MSGMCRVSVLSEELLLLPDRAVWWPGRGTLLIADPHLGKAAALRAARLPLPGGTTTTDLERLSALLAQTGAGRLVVLGDLLHAREGRAPRTMEAVERWRKRHPELDIILVRGNHDGRAGDPPEDWDILCADEPVRSGPLLLRHTPAEDGADGYWLAGHLHPAVLLRGPGRQTERLPCFLFGARGAVLPSFGSFTGSAVVRPGPEDRVFVAVEGTVVEVR